MKVIHNKLVRDLIPEIIKESGKKANYRILENDQEFLQALIAKLVEEVDELKTALNNSNNTDILEEIIDVQEVLFEIVELKNISIKSLQLADLNKTKTKGALHNRIFLESVEDPGGYK